MVWVFTTRLPSQRHHDHARVSHPPCSAHEMRPWHGEDHTSHLRTDAGVRHHWCRSPARRVEPDRAKKAIEERPRPPILIGDEGERRTGSVITLSRPGPTLWRRRRTGIEPACELSPAHRF